MPENLEDGPEGLIVKEIIKCLKKGIFTGASKSDVNLFFHQFDDVRM